MKYTALIYGLLLFLCSACGQKQKLLHLTAKQVGIDVG